MVLKVRQKLTQNFLFPKHSGSIFKMVILMSGCKVGLHFINVWLFFQLYSFLFIANLDMITLLS